MADEDTSKVGAEGDSLVAWLDATLGLAAALLLFAIMTVTVVDVVGRYIFNAPLPGAYELIQIGMALLVFLTLPVLSARDEQVRIDAFQRIFPAGLQPALRLASTIISLVVILGFAWLLWRRGESFVASGETTSNLRLPLAPLAFFVAISWAVAGAVLVAHAARWRRRGERERSP